MSAQAPLLYERVARLVESQIASGTLKTNERIPSVRAMSRSANVSVSTVVQAYVHLENVSLIEARPQSGFYVRRPDPGRLPEPRPRPARSRRPVSVATEVLDTCREALARMDITPLTGVPNTYFVSAELPTSFLQAPAIIYWIHVVNQEEKIQASEKYYLGVKPTYPLDARLELDTPTAKSQGSVLRPSAYVYNEGKPLFGSVSLIVNGKTVDTSTEYVFKGITAIDLTWDVPELDSQTSYDIKARLNLYDKQIDTTSTMVNTFESTKSYPISDVVNVQSITDEQQKIVARAGLLYSSDANPNTHYRVVSPDGKCIIGSSDSCLVNHSTLGKRGNAESIEINSQIFRVRYSGQDSSLETFSITSVDPIVGNWHVSLESDTGLIPDAHASEDTQVKVKYRTMFAKPITLSSVESS